MIENVVWNTGAFEYDANEITVETAYNAERESTTGQICKGTTYLAGAWCSDTVTRTTTWTGKVGLIYPSDYGYASTSGTNIRNTAIARTNWLYSASTYWTLSPGTSSNFANYAWVVWSNSAERHGATTTGIGVRPALYLKSDVSITSGEGTESSPYQISIN